MKKILCIIGTRPEAIKMAPVIKVLQNASFAEVLLLATAQHREMLDQVLSIFDLEPDEDLNLMQLNQTIPELTARLITSLDECLSRMKPDIVLAQGDTTTVFMTALACFHRKIWFGHVEAGLRTGDLYTPFPEEMNRVLAGRLAKLNFAPTESARENLLREGIDSDSVYVTGNPVIDALLEVADKNIPIDENLDPQKRLILVTAHRRENFGTPFLEVCRAIRFIAEQNPDVQILYPVHPNPNVLDTALQELSGHPRIILSKPLEYGPFVSAMKRSYLILTDSGGIQEEAPALGKPVVVLRNETERPEALEAGVVKLAGPNFTTIVSETQKLLDDNQAYRTMAKGISPYGDGKAAGRIARIIEKFL
jgi:UDP-N-acetylglucosamine 2-epimerase (non-hydrolysing)